MRFMNEYEIDRAQARYREDPIMGPATQTLSNLRDAANANSDGWPYWKPPARSASKLMELIMDSLSPMRRWDAPDVTAADVRATYRPIKAFRTRSGIAFDIVEPA